MGFHTDSGHCFLYFSLCIFIMLFVRICHFNCRHLLTYSLTSLYYCSMACPLIENYRATFTFSHQPGCLAVTRCSGGLQVPRARYHWHCLLSYCQVCQLNTLQLYWHYSYHHWNLVTEMINNIIITITLIIIMIIIHNDTN